MNIEILQSNYIRNSPIPAFQLLCLTLLILTGCGYRSGLERVPVSGKASYQGKRIEIGQIRFVPIQSTLAPVTIESISNGEYAANTAGGVPVGDYRVEIRMYDAEEYKNAPRTPGSPAVKQLLPNKYNRDSTLTLKISSGSSAVQQDFVLDK